MNIRLTQFFDAMQEKLEENSYKSGWGQCTNQYLHTRLSQEMAEFKDAIKSRAPHEEVLREAADVANFLFFIVHNYEQ